MATRKRQKFLALLFQPVDDQCRLIAPGHFELYIVRCTDRLCLKRRHMDLAISHDRRIELSELTEPIRPTIVRTDVLFAVPDFLRNT